VVLSVTLTPKITGKNRKKPEDQPLAQPGFSGGTFARFLR
jgi:hypothetical protein